jgi:hypothetical protein
MKQKMFLKNLIFNFIEFFKIIILFIKMNVYQS